MNTKKEIFDPKYWQYTGVIGRYGQISEENKLN
ncbi:hypothetical protein BN2127_JRS8_02562 [Bacillus amyloliquefaciens]|nr:hypothetical protein BN2127_JRS8_02562 [Bacillus amyloliquefaciens]